MRRVLAPEAVTFAVRISPALALLHMLPLIDLAPRYPGVDPWLARLGSRLGRDARADIRLITVPLSGAVRYLLRSPDQPDSCEQGLDALARTPAAEVRDAVLAAWARHLGLDTAAQVAQRLNDDPTGLRDALRDMELPAGEEPYPIDWERVLRLLQHPGELKALLVHRLGSLWHDHMAGPWRRRLDVLQRAAAEARGRLRRGTVEAVFRAVTGRQLDQEEREIVARAGRVIFCPNPFLGPYVSLLGDEIGPDGGAGLWVGYGITAVPATRPADADVALPGGLPAALAAVADEGRLRLLALAAQRGEVAVADIIAALGWTQPTTSRQLRQLVSTGWLVERREERLKRYRVDVSRVDQVAAALRGLLAGGGT